MENLAEKTLDRLDITTNPGKDLVSLYVTLYSLRPSSNLYKQINRLVRLYGRYRTFYAIITMYDAYYGREEKLTLESPISLLAYFCKKQIKEEYSDKLNKYTESLDEYIDSYKESLKSSRYTLPENFEEEDG